ncbi:thioredoxin fold domain-containing protein [Parapedobacter deserti]|uniref:Thioredoxin fold domain-containing protein n=1 Tax=Parapedobacter deserti TaxID=1912957 RepID=A0ABV7JSD0_9SPHI
MKRLALIMLLLPCIALAQQESGTHFEHGLTWAQIKEKAKQENKYLFLDCYTTWCGPCKYMTNNIFPQPKVGEFFNKNFVNAKVQMDKTDADSDEVKSWYDDADGIAKTYNVRAYPTFLIFSPEGELVHRIVGGGEADQFIARAEKALNPETQFYTQLRAYEAGKKTPEFLKNLATAAMDAYEQQKASELANEYLSTQADLYTKENLEFLAQFTQDSKSKGFEIMLNERDKVDAVLGEGTAAKKVVSIVMREDVYPNIPRDYNVNLDSLKGAVTAKYPSVDLDEPFSLMTVQLYQAKKDWASFQPAVVEYMNKYGSNVNAGQLNAFAWAVFENCEDIDCVKEALAWSKRSVDDTEGKTPAFMDTYANLLYKTGDTEQAIAWQQKAIDAVEGEEKANYQATLDKMKKGEKTWPEGNNE